MELPTDLLRTFIAVNDHGGFTRAGKPWGSGRELWRA